MSEELVLFDIPSKKEAGNRGWSGNTWKTRIVLNYKNIPYKTQWIEYPDIAATFASYGIPPNPASSSDATYTVPVVKFPNGDYLMQSYAIAQKLEELFPEPSLHLESESYNKVVAAWSKIDPALAPETRPRVPKNILNPASVEYFERTRAARLGMTLEELSKSDKAGEAAWAAAEPGLQALKAILTENSSGPYIDGDSVSYGDLALAGNYAFFGTIHEDLLKRLLSYDESLQRHYDACKKWLERSTY
ncbi:uncharacterized protein T069G_10644 [Trichoderma breve]|uniref:GST N-terminal domain-containing protein n=1 Tax=Trichoderma breve TaxID=2034170 RepID=A0A9W9B8R7_9HYPO|nr:uncharacterized protein T069G_10644 [Trichoderma breve]KAJ4855086.1 hypothetical protein T069G_10644 [Trichoderma breve]